MKKLLILLLIIPMISFADSYLCIGEASGGVYFDEKTFEASGMAFKPTTKLIFRKEGSGWIVSNFGEQNPLADCKNIKSGTEVAALECQYLQGTARFSFNYLRFIHIYEGGWTGPEKLGDVIFRDTPNVEVGKCSKI